MSSGSAVPPGPASRRLGVGTVLWALIPALSVGFLAAVPFAHAAIRLKQPRMWAVTAAYGAGTLVALVFSTGPEGGQGDEVLGYLVIALMIVATVHAFALRRRVFAPSQQQEVIAAALAARRRRERARAITVRDPALARELRIGRPDLPRQFDDGGLIDVNHVPAQVLVGKLGLSPEQAAQVAETRERLGGLTGPEELVGFSELSEGTVNAVRERLLFLADGVDVSAPPKPEAQPEPEQPPVDGHDDQPGTAAAPEDHQDDRPGAAAEDGQGLPPPGWYPDPAGGPGVRWWDGTRWADRAAEPPLATAARQTSRQLSFAFIVEPVPVAIGFFFAVFVVAMSSDGCASDSCFDRINLTLVLLLVVQAAVVVACGAIAVVGSWKRRIAVKRWAVIALPVGSVITWVAALLMIDAAP